MHARGSEAQVQEGASALVELYARFRRLEGHAFHWRSFLSEDWVGAG